MGRRLGRIITSRVNGPTQKMDQRQLNEIYAMEVL